MHLFPVITWFPREKGRGRCACDDHGKKLPLFSFSLPTRNGMSLFKARDWWATVLGEGEEFDQGCLCVGDVDNSGTGHGKCVCVMFMANHNNKV